MLRLNDFMAVCVHYLLIGILLMLSPLRIAPNEMKVKTKIKSVNIRVISYISSI